MVYGAVSYTHLFGANKTPLILVDGVERSLDLLDPEEIESFSLLKDATATCLLYTSRCV